LVSDPAITPRYENIGRKNSLTVRRGRAGNGRATPYIEVVPPTKSLVYFDRLERVLPPELFDGDWPFVAKPDMRGHEKLGARIKRDATAARANKS